MLPQGVDHERRHVRQKDERWLTLGKMGLGAAVGLITGTLTAHAYLERIVTKVATPIVEARAGAVEKVVDTKLKPHEERLDNLESLVVKHLAEMSGERVHMMQYVDEERAHRKAVLAKLDALCRVTPQAKCPLGVNDK